MISYVRQWERLPKALRRVMEAGVPEYQARADICNAITDGQIKIRIYWASRRKLAPRQVQNIEPEDISGYLRPSDFDWNQSRVRDFRPWINVRGPCGSVLGHWGLMEQARYNSHSSPPQTLTFRRPVVLDWHRVELLRRDVTEVLISKKNDKESAVSESPRQPRSSPRMKAAQRALKELYGQNLPDQVKLPNKLLVKSVIAKLDELRLPGVSPDTILRAAGRRRR